MEEVEGEEELGQSQFRGVTRAPACLTSSSSLSSVPLWGRKHLQRLTISSARNEGSNASAIVIFDICTQFTI